MEKSLSPTRGERMMRLFHHHASRARDVGISRQLIEDETTVGAYMHLDGKRYANFGLCSYLGLDADERLREGAHRAVDRYGTSYSSSIAYTAVPLYGELKERLEKMVGAKVVLAPTTTLAHFSALPVLVRPGDDVLVDAAAHASVQTATQLLQANGIPVRTVPHNDVGALESILAEHDGQGRVWLLVDGVYSMHGDIAPASDLGALLDRHPALHIYCDDAHGFGWDGQRGRGAYLARTSWHDRLVVVYGMAKSFGATGGVIAMPDAELADLVELVGPPLTFGGPIPPAPLGAAVASAGIHLSDELPRLQDELRGRIDLVNRQAVEMAIPLSDLSPTPIWYLDVGDYEKMTRLFLGMRDSGFFLNGSAFPVVPHGHAGLRFTVTMHNSEQQIEDMLTALRERSLEVIGETEIMIDLTADLAAKTGQPTNDLDGTK
ncbi:MAG: aminotransferase class I/II-fold pyridoxal phosphate-dependent enzyme [Acidimicrobiia bacterium]